MPLVSLVYSRFSSIDKVEKVALQRSDVGSCLKGLQVMLGNKCVLSREMKVFSLQLMFSFPPRFRLREGEKRIWWFRGGKRGLKESIAHRNEPSSNSTRRNHWRKTPLASQTLSRKKEIQCDRQQRTSPIYQLCTPALIHAHLWVIRLN